ncbi:MAG: hypothetical protein L0Z55_09970 [Planctomycetes bacterium]|nr:hypothetical protein [Planctomycetota bacterium]
MPGAKSVPLFSDAERAIVGTIYRRAGAESARAWGGERVRARIAEFACALERALELPAISSDTRPRVVCFARGGERSAAAAQHLAALGHSIAQLRGGYRAFREAVRATLQTAAPAAPYVLNGLTGTGKTLVLRAVRRRFPTRVVDLEGIAGHRSSILGDIGLEPVSQKRFESGLAAALRALAGPWSLFEWEGRRLGDRELPRLLYERLRAAPHIELRADLATRVRILCDEYLAAGGATAILARLPSLAAFPWIGTDGVRELTRLIETDRSEEAAAFLLERHYDPRYRHGHRDIPVAHVVQVRDIDAATDAVIAWIEERR